MYINTHILQQLQKLLGPENLLTDELSLALHSYDCSLSRTRPDAVALLPNTACVPGVIRLLNQYKIPFTPRAAGTNHAGGCAALKGGVILDFTRLNRLLEINTQEKYAIAEPGLTTAALQEEAARWGLLYAPDPASARVCTLGGNLAQNASGARCMKYGGTADYILGAEWVSPQGQSVWLSRQSAGPDWLGFLCGSEGTLGVFTKICVRLTDEPKHIKTFLVTFPSLQESIQTVTDLAARGIIPRCVEAMDNATTRTVEAYARAGYPADAEALLILELDGQPKQIHMQAAQLEEICRQNHCQTFKAARTEAERQKLWAGRRAAYAATTLMAPNVIVGDGTVPRSKLPQALQAVSQIIRKYQLQAGLLFHAGDGNFHPHLVFDARNRAQAALTARAEQEILRACAQCGGTISGEHGVGVEKRAAMAFMYDTPTLRFMAALKHALDPANLSNPEKIIPVNFAEKAKEQTAPDPAEQALQTQIKARFAAGETSVITGAGSRCKTNSPRALRTRGLNKVVEIDKQNYTATVQAGVHTQDLQARLEAEGVYAAFPADKGTLGGCLAINAAPAFARQVTGIRAILPDGEIITYGGKVMKNAAGYNLCRLFTGSRGQLGLITQITFKIFAQPQKVQTQNTPQPLWPAPLRAVKAAADPKNLFGVLQEEK